MSCSTGSWLRQSDLLIDDLPNGVLHARVADIESVGWHIKPWRIGQKHLRNLRADWEAKANPRWALGHQESLCTIRLDSLTSILGPSRIRGIEGCWHRLGHYVTRMPRASKLRGLVKPWALRRRTWSRLLVPSILPLEGWPVWCQLRISSDHAMNVSTVSWYSGSSPFS